MAEGRDLLAGDNSSGGGRDLLAAPKAPVSKDSGLMGATTDVLNRGLVATTVGAPVDIANMGLSAIDWASNKVSKATGTAPEQPWASEKPVGGSEWFGQKMQESGMVSPTRRPKTEFAVSLFPAIATGGTAAVKAAGKKIGSMISGGKDLAAELQASTAGKTAQEIADAEKRAGTAEKRAGVAGKIAEREAGKGEAAYGQLPGVEQNIVESDAAIGKRIKDKADDVYSKLKETRSTNAEKNKADAFGFARSREFMGEKIENTKAYQDVLNKIDSLLKDKDTGLAVASLDAIKNPLNQIRRAIDPRYVDEATGVVMGRPISFQGMEDLRRFLRDRSYGLPAEGFDAINQQKAGKLADAVENVMSEFSNGKIDKFISQYRRDSEPLRVFQTKVGKALTDEQLLGKGVNYATVSAQDIPKAMFKNKENFNALIDALGGDVNAAKSEAQRYFVGQLQGKNASQARKFIDDRNNRAMLKETGSYDIANNYVRQLEQAEKRGATAIARGETRAKTAVEQRELSNKLRVIQSDIDRADKIVSPKEKIDYINKQAQKLAEYLPLEQRNQFLTEVQGVVNAEQKKLAIKKWTQIALGGVGLYTTGHIASGYLGK